MAATAPTGAAFDDAEVAELYVHRPPYAAAAYGRILEVAPARRRLLDLGCGEGKVARTLAPHFEEVVAVDPSAAMIALGRSLPGGAANNLRWLHATAEEADLTGKFDVVTFASSIHWMDPARLFSALKPRLGPEHVIGILAGDTPHAPPWAADWERFLARWVPEATGQALGAREWAAPRTLYQEHVEVLGKETFLSDPVRQSIRSFIACQNSRASFTPARLGDRIAAFDADLVALLAPNAGPDRQLEYRVKTELTIARLKG
ncbi:MAG: class I SAM-dependent methyltransferase [Pseudomonadota bacterium]